MRMAEVWLRYFLIWVGLPAIGDPRQADVIIVQSFGRNTYPDRMLFIVRRIFDGIGHDFGTIEKLKQMNVDVGIPNLSLAKECQELSDKYNLPVIVQWEVAVGFDPSWYAKHKEKIFCVWPPAAQDEYFSTWLVKLRTIEIMKEKEWKKPIELAHKRQIARSFLIVRKLLKEKLGAGDVIATQQKTDFFDYESIQFWTKNKWLWLSREALTRVHHLFKGWVF